MDPILFYSLDIQQNSYMSKLITILTEYMGIGDFGETASMEPFIQTNHKSQKLRGIFKRIEYMKINI